ncbi:hypothetical protein DYB34_005065 [Aphanomyces astaci]|nr:hypothetical protein DYB34_005065 [Aphanomyces astaci]
MKQCGESNNAAHNHHHNHADVTDDIKPYPIMTTHIAASNASLPSNAPEGVLYGILHKDLSFREAMELNEALRAVTASPGLISVKIYYPLLACVLVWYCVTVASSQDTPDPTSSDGINGTSVACPRIRKAWDRQTDVEKATYIHALQLSMDQGLYSKFMSIHQDAVSNRQAHGTCVFLFWHRQFLVGFENMLRSLDPPRTSCLTLPYYDYVQHNLDYVNQRCTTIESCSPILRDLGGSTQAIRSTANIGGYTYPQFACVNASVASHFCADSQRSCSGCIPRGPWHSTFFNPDVNFNRVKRAVLPTGSSIAAVTSAIEFSVHNSVHSMLSGVMGNLFISPVEPVFYSHHTTIDLLHTIYHRCRVQPFVTGLTESSASDPRVFQGCSIPQTPNGGVTRNSSVFMQESGLRNNSLMRFFDGLPTTYGGLTDSTQLGQHSYSYDMGGLVGDLYTKCDAAGLGLPEVEERRRLTSGMRHVVRPIASADGNTFLGWRRAVFKRAQAQRIEDSDREMEKMMVMMYANCLPGNVTDYSPEFKAMWGIEGVVAPSKRLLDAIQDGSDTIKISNWTALNQRYFGCGGAFPNDK